MTYTESRRYQSLEQADAGAHRCSSETRTYELTGYVPSGAAGRFRMADLVQPDADGRTAHLFDAEIPYEDVPGSGRVRRLIEHVRMLYRPDDLGAGQSNPSALLPLGALESLALTGETYQLAFTPEHVDRVFDDRVTETMLRDEGGYVQIAGDGLVDSIGARLPVARRRRRRGGGAGVRPTAFLRSAPLPRRVRRDGDWSNYDAHDLLTVRTTDAVGNSVTARTRLPASRSRRRGRCERQSHGRGV